MAVKVDRQTVCELALRHLDAVAGAVLQHRDGLAVLRRGKRFLQGLVERFSNLCNCFHPMCCQCDILCDQSVKIIFSIADKPCDKDSVLFCRIIWLNGLFVVFDTLRINLRAVLVYERHRVLVHGAAELRRVRRITGHIGNGRRPAGERIGVLSRRGLRRRLAVIARRRAVFDVLVLLQLRAVLVLPGDRVAVLRRRERSRVLGIAGHRHDIGRPLIERIGVLSRRVLRRIGVGRRLAVFHRRRVDHAAVIVLPGDRVAVADFLCFRIIIVIEMYGCCIDGFPRIFTRAFTNSNLNLNGLHMTRNTCADKSSFRCGVPVLVVADPFP